MATDEIAVVRGTMPVRSTPSAGKSAGAAAVDRSSATRSSSAPHAGFAGKLPDVKAQLETLVRSLQESQSNLSFSVDAGTGKTVVRVVRRSTGEVVRQIPSEEALAIAERLKLGEGLTTLGFDKWS